MNLLYAQSAKGEDFYQYRITTTVDFSPFARLPVEAQRSGEMRISLVSDHGVCMADPDRFIFIHREAACEQGNQDGIPRHHLSFLARPGPS